MSRWLTNWVCPSLLRSWFGREPKFVGMESSSSCVGQSVLKWLTLLLFLCQGQRVRIRSKYYYRSGERFCVVFEYAIHQSVAIWQWHVSLESANSLPSWLHPTPCQCQNPAELALQHVLLRWKPAVSCSSAGSRFRCFGSVASKSRGTHIFRRIRVA